MKFIFNQQVSSKAKEVFDKVVEHISLKETSLFGLTQVQGKSNIITIQYIIL